MNIRPVSAWTIYRHRYLITYLFLAAFVTALLTLLWQDAPPGMSDGEAQSVVAAHDITFTHMPIAIVDLPYHLLQKGSVWMLGVTPLGVRLPSLLFAAGTALCLALLMRRWFRHNIAALAAIIALSSAWLLAVGRLGTPTVMIPFWTSLILLAATYISQQTPRWRWWKVTFAFAVALSLYTPFMVYLFVAALLASRLQPHLRYLIREGANYHNTLGIFAFLLILAPLSWGLYKDLGQWHDLLAIPAQLPGLLTFGGNLISAINNLVNPYPHFDNELITPLLSLPAVALLMMGGARLLSHFHSVRAYVLLIWAALLVPIVGFNPGMLTVLFVPAMLVVAIGLEALIRYWYRLFPLNPYARFFGVLPIAALILVMVTFNCQRYFYGMLYAPQALSVFNSDVFLAQQQVTKIKQPTPLTMVVAPGDIALYRIVAEQRPHTQVTAPAQAALAPGEWLVAESEIQHMGAPPAQAPSTLIVTPSTNKALRFMLYNR